MGHKVHPKAYRIKNIGDWDARGYYKNLAKDLEEDFRIREFLNKKIGKLGVERVEIERFPGKINIIIGSARPGLIIGRGGEGIEKLSIELRNKILKDYSIPDKKKEDKKGILNKEGKKEIKLEIREVKNPWLSAELSGQWVAQQIEKRMPYRRVLKQGLEKISANKEVQGARIELSGRLNGNEIARREWLASGRLPRQNIRAEIDYAKVEAHCTYGVIGIKIWIFKGEKFE